MKQIRSILTRSKTPVSVQDDVTYKQVTIRTNYKGVVLRGTKLGADIGTKNQWRVAADQFILSRIDARNGAFGIIPAELEGAIVTNDFLAFDINESEVEREFFNVFLQSPVFLDACIKASKGNTNRKRVDESFFLDFEVNLPPFEEQHQLIQKINKARAAIETATHEITHQQTLLGKLKQAILQEAIQGKLTAEWRADNPITEPASELLQRIQAEKARLIAEKKIRKEKPLPEITPEEIPFEIPDGWGVARLQDISWIRGGITKNSAKRDGHKLSLPYLRVANVYANHLDLTEIKEIGLAESEIEKYLLEIDDLLVVEGNGSKNQVGRIAVWDGSISPCLHQNHLINIRLLDKSLVNWALLFYLSPFGREVLEEQARTSTGLYNLSTGKISGLPCVVPPLAEQAAIVERVEALMATCRELEAEIERSRTHAADLLQAVLKEAFAPTP